MDTSAISSAYSDYYSQLATGANATSLSNKISATDSKNATDDELMEVCKEFESYLLEQVFKNMQKSVDIFKADDSQSENQLVDYFKDMTIQEISSQATDQKSLGLAQMLYDQMKVNLGITSAELQAQSEAAAEKM